MQKLSITPHWRWCNVTSNLCLQTTTEQIQQIQTFYDFLNYIYTSLDSRSSTVERSSTRTAAAETFLRFFQTISENTSLWRLKRLVALSTYRRYINKCIYLSIYLSIYPLLALNGWQTFHAVLFKLCFSSFSFS